MSKKIIFGAIALLFCLNACKKDPLQTYTCTGTTPTYTVVIKPILDTNCATSGCHNAATRAEGIDLSTYAGAKAESGKDAFLGAIEHASGYEAMPQGRSQLPDSTIQKIYCWVNNGTPN